MPSIDQASLSVIEAGRGRRLQLGFGRSIMMGADTRAWDLQVPPQVHSYL